MNIIFLTTLLFIRYYFCENLKSKHQSMFVESSMPALAYAYVSLTGKKNGKKRK